MKIESTGLPTVLDEKKNSPFIELTLLSNSNSWRALFSLAHISLVVEGVGAGCYIHYGDCESYVTVRESYDEVKRLMEEADR